MTSSLPLSPSWPLRSLEAVTSVAELVGRERWSLVVVRDCVASTLSVTHLSWRPGQEIKAQQLCPCTPLGQRPQRWMACQPLSTTPVYSTINLEMSGFPHWTIFRFSGAVRERWQLLPRCVCVCVFEKEGGWSVFTHICKSEVDRQLAFALTQLKEFKCQE